MRRVKLVCRVDIHFRSVALSLPVAGYLDLVPVTGIVIRAVEVGRPFAGILRPTEIPVAVERHIPRRVTVTLITDAIKRSSVVNIRHHAFVRIELARPKRRGVLPLGQMFRKNRYGRQQYSQQTDFFHGI